MTISQILKEKLGLKQLIGEHPKFISEIKKIPCIAQCDSTVLITGETGTGKELFARAIHYLSQRADMPFVPVNCGAIPSELVENELFGHIQGAYTSASSSQNGLILKADSGTLYLDEIDCLPILSQVKLLRFLQEKEYRMLGTTKVCNANVRVVASTNTDLKKAVKNGTFRKDLFFRLNIIPVKLPSLKERKEDIPLLARHFLAKFASRFKKNIMDFTSEALQKLILYDWPGNVRELENIIERTIVFTTEKVIQGENIFLTESDEASYSESFQEAKNKAIAQFERDYIRKILFAYQGNITRAAEAAQKNRRAFWELIRKHKIDVQNYKADHF